MELPSSRNAWIEWIALTVVALALSQMNVLFFLFLVPLQVIYHRRDLESCMLSGALVAVLILVLGFVRSRGIESADLRRGILVMELSLPVLLLLGLLWTDYSKVLGYRALYRLLTGTAGAALIGVLIILGLSRNQELVNLLREQFEAVAREFQSGFARQESFESSVLSGVLAPERMVEYTKTLFFKGYVFFYFLLLTGCWYLADLVRMRIRQEYRQRLDSFTLPDFFIWPLILAWAGVLLDTWKDAGVIGYIFWNVGLIFLFLYGLQGIGVLRALFNRYRVPVFIRMFIGLVCIILAARPGLNLIVFIGIPGLGVSELWILYRRNQ